MTPNTSLPFHLSLIETKSNSWHFVELSLGTDSAIHSSSGCLPACSFLTFAFEGRLIAIFFGAPTSFACTALFLLRIKGGPVEPFELADMLFRRLVCIVFPRSSSSSSSRLSRKFSASARPCACTSHTKLRREEVSHTD